jgi:plasmid segregation protein ParM
MVRLAIDIGYSQVKAVCESGGQVSFPSVVAPPPPDLGLNGGDLPHRVRVRRGNQEEDRVIGEAALQAEAAVASLNREKPAGIHDLLLVAAAYLLGAGRSGSFYPGQGVPTLAVGLPLAYYRDQRPGLQRRLSELSAWVGVNGGVEKQISFGVVKVYPQGAGAVPGQPGLLEQDGLVGVVDVGRHTTEYVLLDVRDGQPRPILEACNSVEIGAGLVHRAVAAEFQARTGAPLPGWLMPQALDMAQGGALLEYGGRRVDLNAAYERALGDAVRAITQSVLAGWGSRAEMVRQTLLIGGGAVLLGGLRAGLPAAVVAADPVFANARGYLAALGAPRSGQ